MISLLIHSNYYDSILLKKYYTYISIYFFYQG